MTRDAHRSHTALGLHLRYMNRSMPSLTVDATLTIDPHAAPNTQLHALAPPVVWLSQQPLMPVVWLLALGSNSLATPVA